MTTLMFWNKQNSGMKNQNDSKSAKKNWLHGQETLINGHVVYPVKFLGSIAVDQPKGIDTVKDAIRRLQFAQQIKKADVGYEEKSKKVEITISIHGVAIQEPKENKVLYQFPLHTISYCTDEKGVKKFFSFIVKITSKNNENGNNDEMCHKCFVFISSKLASDITLTIGQAFELAYSRYVNDTSTTTKITDLQKKNTQLEDTITIYRKRLKDLTDMLPKSDVDALLSRYDVQNIYEIPTKSEINNHFENNNKNGFSIIDKNEQLLITDFDGNNFSQLSHQKSSIQNHISQTLDAIKPSIDNKMEELLLNSDSDSDFDPRADEHNNDMATNFHNSSPFGQSFLTNNNHEFGINNKTNILKPTPFCT